MIDGPARLDRTSPFAKPKRVETESPVVPNLTQRDSGNYEIHEVANLFPYMQPDEYEALKQDILENGLREPIWLHERKIVDGRNRYRACLETGVEPTFKEWDRRGSLVAFVVSMNVKRRHLTAGQRAMIGIEVDKQFAVEAKNRQRLAGGNHGNQYSGGKVAVPSTFTEPPNEDSRDAAAKAVGVANSYISDAKTLSENHPDLAAQVKSGTMTIPEAKKIVRKSDNVQRETDALADNPASDLWTVTDNQAVVPCDLLITDPPYGILDENWEPDDLRVFTLDWLSRWNDCGADLILSFFSQEHMWGGKAWFDEALQEYQFQQLLIWHYPNNIKPQSRQMFKQTWEPIFVYRRKDAVRNIEPYSAEWGEDGLNGFDCHVAATPQSNYNEADFKQHAAQKPISVMNWLVNAVSKPGELICDPFCGSGTTGIAATKSGRRFHGIESDPETLELARRRLATYGA